MKKVVVFCILYIFITVTAFSQVAFTLDAALSNSTFYLNGRIPPKSKVAVLNFSSNWPELSDYVIEELIGNIVNDNALTVVDRANLESIRKEMNFQLSGNVSEETTLSVGKMLGAQIIISGAMAAVGNTYRLRIRAISVETAQILGMQNVDVAHDSRLAALTGTGYAVPSVTAQAAAQSTNPSGKLNVWAFNDDSELKHKMINSKYFKPPFNKTVQVTVSLTPFDHYHAKLDSSLFTGNGAPDVFALESSVVRKYIESGFLLDLTDIYEANRQKLISYPVDVGSFNGRVYGLSWQAAPGAMFYRRSLAKKYLGSDDPAVVQNYFSSMNKFIETAQLLKNKSNGVCAVIPSYGELYNLFLYNRKSPWVVNRQLVIDPAMEQYMDMCKTIVENRYVADDAWKWGEGWFKSMRGEHKNFDGKPSEVFSYFLPTWGLHYVLKPNAPKTSGDWAMIPGPLSYRDGGTWLCAWRDTPNPAAAKELIRYLITDDKFMEEYAKATGDLVSNLNVVNKISKNFKEPFLKKQNHYAEFAELAKKVDGRLLTGYDNDIEGFFNEEVSNFLYNGKSKQQALDDFRAKVEYNLLRGK